MKNIIHHIRRQPEKVRRNILHVLTVFAGVLLLLLWVYSLGANLGNPDLKVKAENDLKPFITLKNNIVDGYKSISQPDTTLQQ